MPSFCRAAGRRVHALSISAAMLACLLLSGCANRETAILTDACIKSGHSLGALADQALLKSQCECSALAAKKYLDSDNYKLLVGVAEIYNENTSDSVKLQKLVTGFVNSGMTTAKASIAAIDMISLAHKVAGECSAGNQNKI